MESKERRQFSSEQKAEAIKRHVVGKENISAICEDLGIAPNQFYRWQAELFDHGAAAFEVKKRGAPRRSREAELEKKVVELEERLAHKDGVIAEVVEECVTLKKKLGQS